MANSIRTIFSVSSEILTSIILTQYALLCKVGLLRNSQGGRAADQIQRQTRKPQALAEDHGALFNPVTQVHHESKVHVRVIQPIMVLVYQIKFLF